MLSVGLLGCYWYFPGHRSSTVFGHQVIPPLEALEVSEDGWPSADWCVGSCTAGKSCSGVELSPAQRNSPDRNSQLPPPRHLNGRLSQQSFCLWKGEAEPSVSCGGQRVKGGCAGCAVIGELWRGCLLHSYSAEDKACQALSALVPSGLTGWDCSYCFLLPVWPFLKCKQVGACQSSSSCSIQLADSEWSGF